ncbi:MAG TPA: bifunctional enoyl-CoA hydratase/phosphate acetyltransferase [Rhizobiales bacterium]|nr:bifunctional enoyl-CoA hydratase/phosphate acetyltransferase [Hyphomicrobiales bacterium]
MKNIPEPQCPPALLAAVKNNPPRRVGVVNAGKNVVLEAVRDAVEAGLMEPVLYGDENRIKRCAQDLGWAIDNFEIFAAKDEHEAAMLAAHAAGRGELDILMKGHIHTDEYLRAILNRDAGLRTSERLTHVFSMTFPDDDKPLLITDAAVNASPDFITHKSIIGNAVSVARQLGIARPKVAFLSATETPNEHIASSLVARELTEWAKENIPDAEFCGPLAFDLCVSEKAAKIKGVDDPVAGAADVIVVPEVVVGNALFKAMVHMMGACSAGVVMGAKVPVVLTSRADPVAARLASVALANLMCR